MKQLKLIVVGLVALLLAACQPATEQKIEAAAISTIEPYVKLSHPEWTKDAVIYQLNTRQFSEEGTFQAAKAQLPRLKALGVDIIWLMPIHPIGEVNRKGSLGSPYSVKDYFDVNPEFGSKADFKAFVAAAHELGLYGILDWVANHTAWAHVWVAQPPDWS